MFLLYLCHIFYSKMLRSLQTSKSSTSTWSCLLVPAVAMTKGTFHPGLLLCFCLTHLKTPTPPVSPTPGFKSPRVQKSSNLVQSLKQIKVIGWPSALFHLYWNSTNSCFICEITTCSPLWPAGGSICQVTDASFLSADSSLEGFFLVLVMIYHPKTH